MSKRYFPQQYGDRKKAKLDVTISDHNFPLSQNAGSSKETDQADKWGDDNDDEILLLASQACEEAYNDISTITDYSICMQPRSTSTQIQDPGPSTSKFSFKKPSAIPPSVTTTDLKDKCNRISSPLPGMSLKAMSKANEHVNLSDDLIFNDNIFKGQDSDYVYRQLLQLQEDNAKLKSENGKLLEKCVTKEGEASILRSQLKASQVSVDNARLERVRAQERAQAEWAAQLAAATSQLHDLRTQLDFKNLEIISVKERCRMLESKKVKLTQVTVANNDISSRNNNSINIPHDSSQLHARKVKMASNSVQTENKAYFLKLNKTWRSESPKLREFLPLILTSTSEQPSLLEYHEKLQARADLSQNKCRVFSTFHRIPCKPAVSKEVSKSKLSLAAYHEDLTRLVAGDHTMDTLAKVVGMTRAVLAEAQEQLEAVSGKMTTAFQREMDERHVEATISFLEADDSDLLCGRALYKEEQAILARRMTSILACVVQSFPSVDLTEIIQVISRICHLLDSTSCAVLYSGLLLSVIELVRSTPQRSVDILRSMVSSRPLPLVSCRLLQLARRLRPEELMTKLCPGSSAGNLKMDYDQGVLLYKKDSCYLQVLLKQIEASLKCIEKQCLTAQAVSTAQSLLGLHANLNDGSRVVREKHRCDCQLVLMQVIVYALRICAVMLNKRDTGDQHTAALLATCRAGVRVLYGRALRDVEFGPQLGHNEGHLLEFCDLMRLREHDEAHVNMLSEVSGTFQSLPEETSCFHKQAWINSFKSFSIAD